MSLEAVTAQAVCAGCHTRWKLDAIWDSDTGRLVVFQDLQPCPLCRCDELTVGYTTTGDADKAA